MAIWLKVVIAGGIGMVIGGVVGHFGKCSSGQCPFTANPYRGAVFGLLVGVLAVLAMGRTEQSVADNVPHLETLDEFEAKVLKAERPVLVDFYSDRCPPCRQLAPVISKLHVDYRAKADVFKVNVDEARELAGRYRISAIPTVMLFNRGKIVDGCTWVGARDQSVYRSALDSAGVGQER